MNTIGVVFLTMLAVQCGACESLRGLGMFSLSFPVLKCSGMWARSAELSSTGCHCDADKYRIHENLNLLAIKQAIYLLEQFSWSV